MNQDTFDEAIHAVLTEREVRELVRLSKVTLLRMRQQKDQAGLPFIQLSPGRIGYRRSDVEAYLIARRVGKLPGEVAEPAQHQTMSDQPVPQRRAGKLSADRSLLRARITEALLGAPRPGRRARRRRAVSAPASAGR